MNNFVYWPGSSSFYTGSTPFGFFDTDPLFVDNADKVAKYVTKMLGYPTLDVELVPETIYACFEAATLEYSNQVNQFAIRDNMFVLQGTPTGSNFTGLAVNPNLNRAVYLSKNYGTEANAGGNITHKQAYVNVVKGKTDYDFNEFVYEDPSDANKSIEVRRIFHAIPPAISRYFDPFSGMGIGTQQLLNEFGWAGMSPAATFMLLPVYADLLRIQAIEFNDEVRRSAYTFELTGTKLKLFPIPLNDTKVYLNYITVDDRNDLSNLVAPIGTVGDFTNAPYQLHRYSDINQVGRSWIYQYTLALCKEALGNIRGKYSTVPIPDSELTLNPDSLLEQANNEKERYILELRENLEATSRTAQMEKMSQEADYLQNQLNKAPLKIYIF